MKHIRKVGVIGAGTMGSALAQKFAQEGFPVVLVDREMSFVKRGISGIQKTLNEAVQRKLFTEAQTRAILSRIQGSDKLQALSDCDLVTEAIFEDFQAKSSLFQQLNDILSPETILATNTSSFSITELAATYRYPENFIGMHYFYHAAKNRLVEIIPGEKTSPETIASASRFAQLTGKDPIYCKDVYGFAVNRYFVPWLNEAVRLLEEGVADAATIDTVCIKTFHIGMGPFALMNATGVPIAYHAQKTLTSFGPFYRVAELLEKQAQANQPWEIGAAPVEDVDEAVARTIRERMLGTVFLVCAQILDEQVCSATELNRGARIGLRWRYGPIELMNQMGDEEVGRLIRQMGDRYRVNVPDAIGSASRTMQFVEMELKGNLAVITIRRPEDLNAINETVVSQLSEAFDRALADPKVKIIMITGSGKAFVAGADIKFFVDNIKRNRIDRIVEFTENGQSLFEKIDQSPKTVVAAINGLTLGGGLELALCADFIVASSKAMMAFPETGIGIYPGLGGTYRTQQRIGKALTKYMIYTGKMLSASAALEIGLIDAVLEPEDFLTMKAGELPIPQPVARKSLEDTPWAALADFFNRYTVLQILSNEISESNFPAEETERLVKTIQRKAPVALHIAEKLIDQAQDPRAELKFLPEIFSTADALLGLSSIGKRVTFSGK